MMIVYFSLALVVGTLVYFGVSVFKTYKAAKPTIESLTQTAERMQVKADTLKVETNKLKDNQQELAADIDDKKKAINSTVFAVKQTPVIFKQLMKVKPLAEIERRWKLRRLNLGRHEQ